jgi:uncharacterized RDD family membrane protein YckC
LNQAAKQDVESSKHTSGPVLVKGAKLVVHSRDAATAAAAARVVARYAQLPSYSSLNPDWRAKLNQPVKRAAKSLNTVEKPLPKPMQLAQVKPLAWLSEVEETITTEISAVNRQRNQSGSSKSAEEADVNMTAGLIEEADSMRDWTSLKQDAQPDQLSVVSNISAAQSASLAPLANRKPGIQLSIFEVDPGALTLDHLALDQGMNTTDSTEMIAAIDNSAEMPPQSSYFKDASKETETFASLAHTASPITIQPIGSLATELADSHRYEREAQHWSSIVEIEEPMAQTLVEGAPCDRRILAGLLDFALILCAFAFLAFMVARFAPTALGSHGPFTLGSLVFFAVAFLYQGFFTLLLRETPGARFAELRISTLNASRPTLLQMGLRILLLPISVLPAGLGILWSLVDAQHLCWHDRLSGTCLRYQY